MHTKGMRLSCAGALFMLMHGLASAQGASDAAIKAAQSAGDNAWMLTSAALVLMMTGPGLALFYGGLVRRKNVLGTMMHSFIMMALVTVIWVDCGLQSGVRRRNAVHRRSAVSCF